MLERIVRDSFKGITIVEEEVGSINKLLSRQIATAARASGLRVCLVTLTEEAAPVQQERIAMESTIGGAEEISSVPQGRSVRRTEGAKTFLEGLDFDLIVINSFSNYFVDKSERDAVYLIREIESLAQKGKSFLISYEPGILSEKATAFLRSIADNVLVIRTQLVGDRVDRMLYVPKVTGEEPLDRLIKITVDGAGIQEDTREFVG